MLLFQDVLTLLPERDFLRTLWPEFAKVCCGSWGQRVRDFFENARTLWLKQHFPRTLWLEFGTKCSYRRLGPKVARKRILLY